MQNNYVIIMAGGVGTRFWPFSRTHLPKQFHDVLGTGKSLLQQTFDRFSGVCPTENIYVVTSEEYTAITLEQLPLLGKDQLLAEPIRRNTAPCIAYACYKIASRNPKANIVVAPADHIILKEEVFREKIHIALHATAQSDALLTLGITPSRPDTGYGYIQYLELNDEVKKVKTFTEKPHLELAEKFLESGDFVWNAGIFVWNVHSIIVAFRNFLPEIHEVFSEGKKVYFTPDETTFIARAYTQCRSISIDNGIMEKAKNVGVVLSDIGWSDLGTWKSLYEISEKDAQQNATDGRHLLFDTKNCIIKTPHHRLVVVQGLDNYIVAEYDNVLLICQKKQEQRVKDFVAEAKRMGQEYI